MKGNNYSEYLNTLMVQYATGSYFEADASWKDTETIKLNKFYYVTDGCLELDIYGKKHLATAGQLVMIPADTKHSYKVHGNGIMHKHWCHFEAETGGTNLFDIIKTDLIVDIGISKKLIGMFKSLYKYESSPSVASALASKATLMMIISRYLDSCKSITTRKKEEKAGLGSIIQYMKDNTDQSITVEELANMAHLHPNYFIRLFKQQFGASPIKYFNSLKLSRAKQYLLEEDLSVEDISKRLGFADLYSFSKFFKNNVGISPTRFKRNYIDKER